MASNLHDETGAPPPAFRLSNLTAWAKARMEACHRERRDAAENRQRILDTARALFAERGVDAVSMVDVARAAGFGQGTLYRRYPHKGALCEALLEDNLSSFHDAVMAHLAARADTEPALEQLACLLTRLLAFTEGNAPLLSAMGEATGRDRRSECYRDPWHTWLYETVAALLSRAAATGETPPLDDACLADALLAATDPDLYHFQRCERGIERERIAASLRQLVMGLRATSAAEG